MIVLDNFSLLNGIAITLYMAVYLISGLQLRFNIYRRQNHSATLLSRWFGNILMGYVASTMLYAIYMFAPELELLTYINTCFDFILMSMLGCCAYIVYANRRPPLKVMAVTMLPYIVYIVLICLVDFFAVYAYDAAMLTLICQYLFYVRSLHSHEKKLNDLYANPEAHSLRWLIVAAVLYFILWAVHSLFIHTEMMDYYDIVIYSITAVIAFYVAVNVSNYAEPVSLETLQQLETPATEVHNLVAPAKSQAIQEALVQLYEQQQVYLNPDLTIDDVALAIKTNTKYLSFVLNREMSTSFYEFTSKYRIQRAKHLLETTNDKMAVIALQSGFNSPQALNRTFARFTGKTPSEWRGK